MIGDAVYCTHAKKFEQKSNVSLRILKILNLGFLLTLKAVYKMHNWLTWAIRMAPIS